VPSIEQLKKEGEAGRRKITQYTRYGTVALALFQGLGIAIALESQAGLVLDPGPMFRFVTVLTLLTGTMFLMWLGEQITERGLGQRHFHHHLRRYRRRLAERTGRFVRTGSHRRDARYFGPVYLCLGGWSPVSWSLSKRASARFW
jgi:hypothetical protein